LSVSLLADSVFAGGHDGISAGSEQAQTLQSPAELVVFHLGQISLPFGHYEICRWKFPKNLSKSEVLD
jgi:hypothetical protein